MQSYSHSKIKLWDECELKFCAHELLKLKPKVSLSTEPKVQLGSLLHRFFYEFYKNQIQTNLFKSCQITLNEWQEDFQREWQLLIPKLIFKDHSHKEAHLKRGFKALENFYAHEKKRSFKLPIYLEQKFKINLGSFNLTGIIDRVDREDDGSLTVIDYKITEQMQSSTSADNDLQLSIYHLACLQSLAKEAPNNLVFYYPLQNELLYTSRNKTHIEEMIQKIESINLKITERGANPTKYKTSPAEWKCGSCAYRSECPEHKFEHTLELPKHEEMLQKAQEYIVLKCEQKQTEDKLKSLEFQIKDYMLTHNLNKIGELSINNFCDDI